MRRRTNPYSRYSAIDDSRRALREIIVLVLMAGLLVNLVSGFLSDLLKGATSGHSPLVQALVYLLLLVGLVALMTVFVFRYHSRTETSDVRLEVVLPYCFSDENGVRVRLQHPYRPNYRVVEEARRLFSSAHRTPKERQQVASAWRDAPPPKRIQQHLADTHQCLVDALLLQLLHRYGADSLGPEAAYDWYGVPLAATARSWDDLPPALRDNPYIAAQRADAPGWRLLLPAGVEFQVEKSAGDSLWWLHHRYMDVRIRCFAPPGARNRGQAVMIFAEPHPARPGKPPETCDELWVLGTRLLAKASFAYSMLRRIDPYHRWATRLLTYLEEGLDWEYFLSGRSGRILADVPWKLGDMPRNESIWGKLDAIDRRLSRLEKRDGL